MIGPVRQLILVISVTFISNGCILVELGSLLVNLCITFNIENTQKHTGNHQLIVCHTTTFQGQKVGIEPETLPQPAGPTELPQR